MLTKEIKRKFRIYEQKIIVLWNKKLRIEALLYMSLIVELFTKEAIFSFEKIIEGSALQYNVGFNPRNLYTRADIESQPLGYLIKILDTYTRNKKLIKDLKHFSEVRNKCIHKLLDHEIKDINKELRNFNKFYYKLMVSLFKLNLNQLKLTEKSFFHVCDECFKRDSPKHIKI